MQNEYQLQLPRGTPAWDMNGFALPSGLTYDQLVTVLAEGPGELARVRTQDGVLLVVKRPFDPADLELPLMEKVRRRIPTERLVPNAPIEMAVYAAAQRSPFAQQDRQRSIARSDEEREAVDRAYGDWDLTAWKWIKRIILFLIIAGIVSFFVR